MLRDTAGTGNVRTSETGDLHWEIAGGNFLQAQTIVYRMQPAIISIINQKGGCAKSSTCFHTAGYFAKAGYRVLLVDADPQGSLSQAFFGSTKVEMLRADETLAAVFDSECLVERAEEILLSTHVEGIDLVPANLELSKFNVPEPMDTGMAQFALASLLESTTGYDIVLIDCPPNLYQCSWNALLASDYVAIPLNADDFGVQGLRTVQEAIVHAQQLNPKLALLGQFLTRFDRRVGLHREYESALRRIYGDHVFRTVIFEAAAFKSAVGTRMPVTHYSSWSRATRQTKNFALEMLERMEQHKAERKVA